MMLDSIILYYTIRFSPSTPAARTPMATSPRPARRASVMLTLMMSQGPACRPRAVADSLKGN